MMKSFEQIIQDCPEAVREFVAQTVVVNEYVRIDREIDGFARTLICMGMTLKRASKLGKVFATICDGFDRSEKAA